LPLGCISNLVDVRFLHDHVTSIERNVRIPMQIISIKIPAK
jgi:hypothetical protein